MPKKQTDQRLTLKRRKGRPRGKTATMTVYAYQKRELRERARARAVRMGYRDMSISAYLNLLLWGDWR